MLDVYLTRALLRALPKPSSRQVFVLLVGDADQLPSVGPGRVLGDLIGSGTVATTQLQRVFRQAASSSIVFNAHMINRGKIPERMWSVARDAHSDLSDVGATSASGDGGGGGGDVDDDRRSKYLLASLSEIAGSLTRGGVTVASKAAVECVVRPDVIQLEELSSEVDDALGCLPPPVMDCLWMDAHATDVRVSLSTIVSLVKTLGFDPLAHMQVWCIVVVVVYRFLFPNGHGHLCICCATGLFVSCCVPAGGEC